MYPTSFVSNGVLRNIMYLVQSCQLVIEYKSELEIERYILSLNNLVAMPRQAGGINTVVSYILKAPLHLTHLIFISTIFTRIVHPKAD